MTVEIRNLTVETADRLDKFLARELNYSRSRLQKAIESGEVTVDGETIEDKSHRVSPGDPVRINLGSIDDPQAPPEPEEGPLTIHFEDDQILAVEKPAGMVVHPNPNTRTGTLVNRILHHYPEQSSFERAGLIHRLDRGTSGIVLVGRTEKAIKALKQQFKQRSVKKQYRAVLGGVLEDDTIKVDVPIGRDPQNPMLRTAAPEGKKAVTELDVMGRANGKSAVVCRPVTGRTHQIRVHCRYLNAPVLGDKKYNGPAAERLILHAETIEFNHPDTAQSISLTSEIPEEVRNQWLEICPSSP